MGSSVSLRYMEKRGGQFRLGITGGGQLGKMLCQVANTWDVHTVVMDATLEVPCAKVCSEFVKGSFKNYEDLYQFGKTLDVLVLEIEHVNLQALFDLKKEGLTIIPDPNILQTIQDKGLQKDFFKTHTIPSPAYQLWENKEEITSAIKAGELSFPFVQKTRKEGYDGRGVAVIKNTNDLSQLLDSQCLTETLIDLKKELSVIVARNKNGEIKTYPTVEMVFHPLANMVERLLSPAAISPKINQQAQELAQKLAEKLNLNGILAVEMFLDKSNALWVNELAPRAHNSGHQTIEGNITSQYQQWLRVAMDYPLGNTEITSPTVMINLLGQENQNGDVKIQGLQETLSIPGVYVHIYGKPTTKPFRKMGHVTIMDKNLEQAIKKADIVKNTLKFNAW